MLTRARPRKRPFFALIARLAAVPVSGLTLAWIQALLLGLALGTPPASARGGVGPGSPSPAADTGADTLAESARPEVIPFDLPYGQAVPLPLEQVLEAEAADSERVRIEIEQGRLTLTGLKKGQTMLYIRTANGLRLYRLNITAPVLNTPRRNQLLPVLLRNPDLPSGVLGLQILMPFADSPQLPQLQANYLLELGSAPGPHWLARLSSQNVFTRGWPSLERSTLAALKATYQDASRIVDLGDTGLWSMLTPLLPSLLQFRGGQWTESLDESQYQIFAGTSLRPLYLYGGPSGAADRPWLGGASGQWHLPLAADGSLGDLGAQVLAMAQSGSDALEPRFAAGLNWNLHQQLGLNLALGTNLKGLGLLSGAYLQQRWGKLDWLNLSAMYRHLDQAYQTQNPIQRPSQQDLLNLRFSSGFGNGWGLAGSSSLLLAAGTVQSGQGVLRLNHSMLGDRIQLYAQAGSFYLDPGLTQQELKLGWILRQDLVLTGYYSWRLNQLPRALGQNTGFQQHQLQLQTRLFDLDYAQLWLVSQTQYQPDGAPGAAQHLNEALGLQLYAPVDQTLILRGNLGYLLNQFLGAPPSGEQGWNAGLGVSWLPSPFHQLQMMLSYQRLPGSETPDLLGFGLDYNWRYGYEAVDAYAHLEGRVFIDRNRNGQPDADEPGAPGVRVRLDQALGVTDAEGYFRLAQLPPGARSLELDESSLPVGFQTSENVREIELRAGANPQLLVPLRDEMTISGLVFASPLLATGLDGIGMLLDGAPAATTAFGGRFAIMAKPGAHSLSIDPLTIPTGYRLEGQLSRSFDSQHNLTLDFVLRPQLEMNLVLLDQPRGIRVASHELLLRQGGQTRIGTTDAQGLLALSDLLPGELEIRDRQGHLWRIELPDKPSRLQRVINLAESEHAEP